jgi:DNA-binding CsgD family transcriptional regulator/PAS domain-containing protein
MRGQEAQRIEELLRVVELTYNCALDPSHWSKTLPALSALTNSAAAVLSVRGGSRAQSIFHHGYASYMPLDEQHVAATSLALAGQALCVGELFSQGSLLDPVKFLNSRFYNEWCRPGGLRHALGMAVSGSREIVLILNRLEGQPSYGDRDIRLLRLLMPHVCRALKMADVVGLRTMRSDTLEAVLDRLSAGLYLIDRNGRIVFMNQAAKCQIKAGNVLRVADNRLSPTSAEARHALVHAITTACSDSAGQCAKSVALPPQKDGQVGFIATVLAVNHRRQGLPTPFVTCAVFVQDPHSTPPVPGEAFASLFGLTPAELDVLLALAAGQAPQGAADALGIALSTVKSHLHKIFEKTGTLRQADLVRLLMGSSLQIASSMRAAVPDLSHSSLHAGVERHPTIPNPAERVILRAKVPALQVAQASSANPTLATGSVAVSVGGDRNARTSVSSLNGR